MRQLRELVVDGVEVVVVLAKSYPLSSIPKKSGIIRVTDYHQSLAIKSDGKTGTKGELVERDLAVKYYELLVNSFMTVI